MSVPRDKIEQLIKKLEQLDEKDAEQAVIVIEDFLKNKRGVKRKKPSDYIGALSHLDINVEEECKKMREEWDNRGWESNT